MLRYPLLYQVGNLFVVHFLKHKVAVAVDVMFGKVDYISNAAVLDVLLGKIAALFQNRLPKSR